MPSRSLHRIALLVALMLPYTLHAADAAAAANANPYAPALKVLFELFALAVVLESGLAVIFNWRPFLELFDARGVKTIVSVAVALVLVDAFNLDLTTELVHAFNPQAPSPGWLGIFLTALVLAGGSSGVNNLLVALGFRSMKTADSVTPKPPPTKAWVAVRVERRRDAAATLPVGAGTLQVFMKVDQDKEAYLGPIPGRSPRNRLLRYFLRDRGRFPPTGGFSIEPGKEYTFTVADGKGVLLTGLQWGPKPIVAGAIVDAEFTVREP